MSSFFKRFKSKQTSSSRPLMNKDQLRSELSDPVLLKKHMNHLEELIQGKKGSEAIRFPGDILLERIEEISDRDRSLIDSMQNETSQREYIIDQILPGFLSKGFLREVESKLIRILEAHDSEPDSCEVKAVGAGLFFLELHRRRPDLAGKNPLWDVIFDISYAEASQEHRSVQAGQNQKGPAENTATISGEFLSAFELSEEISRKMSRVIRYIEQGDINLGFSLDTILQGLRAYRIRPAQMDVPQMLSDMKIAYDREIREREREDLIWGLEYAKTRNVSGDPEILEQVLDMVSLLPPRDNPVIFALYYRCVTEFYRFLKEDELDAADAIIRSISSPEPLLKYAGLLLEKEAPRRAIKVFEAASVLDSSSSLAEFGIGLILWEEESFHESRLHFNRALKLSGNDTKMASLAGKCGLLTNDDPLPKEAIDYLMDSIIKSDGPSAC